MSGKTVEEVGFPGDHVLYPLSGRVTEELFNSEPMITIPIKLYDELQEHAAKYLALQDCGVANWVGYKEAVRYFPEKEKETE